MKRIIISAFTVISFAIVATASASDCIANSPTELQSKFEQAFKAKNNTALLSLFNWSGIEPSLEGQLRKEYSNLSLNKNSIYSELKDPNIAIREANSMNFYLNVTPIKTLYFETSAYLNNKISLELNEQDPVAVKLFLSQYLIEDLERDESVSDALARRLKI